MSISDIPHNIEFISQGSIFGKGWIMNENKKQEIRNKK
jgi:hypothetical protein